MSVNSSASCFGMWLRISSRRRRGLHSRAGWQPRRSGVDAHLWREMAEMAWQGILVPENYGGMGLTLAEMSTVLQELGRAAYQGPFFTTAVSSVLALNQCDKVNRKQELLKGIIDGNWTVFLALDKGYEYKWQEFASTAVRNGRKFRLNGHRLVRTVCPCRRYADCRSAVCRRRGSFAVDRSLAGVEVAVLPVMSGEKLCSVQFDDVYLPEDCLLNAPEHGSRRSKPCFISARCSNVPRWSEARRPHWRFTVEQCPIESSLTSRSVCSRPSAPVRRHVHSGGFGVHIQVDETIDVVLRGDRASTSPLDFKVWVVMPTGTR